MDIKEIAKMYGTSCDYYEMQTGRIFLFTESTYDPEKNNSTIPVSKDSVIIGNIVVEGNIKEID